MRSVNSELANSVRRINSQYYALAEDDRPDFDERDWRQLEEAIDGAALAAIRRWERHAASVLRGTE